MSDENSIAQVNEAATIYEPDVIRFDPGWLDTWIRVGRYTPPWARRGRFNTERNEGEIARMAVRAHNIREWYRGLAVIHATPEDEEYIFRRGRSWREEVFLFHDMWHRIYATTTYRADDYDPEEVIEDQLYEFLDSRRRVFVIVGTLEGGLDFETYNMLQEVGWETIYVEQYGENTEYERRIDLGHGMHVTVALSDYNPEYMNTDGNNDNNGWDWNRQDNGGWNGGMWNEENRLGG